MFVFQSCTGLTGLPTKRLPALCGLTMPRPEYRKKEFVGLSRQRLLDQ